MSAFDPFGSESSNNINLFTREWMFLSWFVAFVTKLDGSSSINRYRSFDTKANTEKLVQVILFAVRNRVNKIPRYVVYSGAND